MLLFGTVLKPRKFEESKSTNKSANACVIGVGGTYLLLRVFLGPQDMDNVQSMSFLLRSVKSRINRTDREAHKYNVEMKKSIWRWQELKMFLLLGVFVTGVLFVISPDSYTHDLFGRCDSAWFYMCGKAWMNGLVPYVDFSDSKGPLLWLIYGIGYLMSPYNYIGVFWISCLWYSLTYFYTYKTACLFLNDNRKSLLCALFMTLAYFNPWFHHETRAEDFAHLFMVLSLYRTALLLYSDRVTNKDIHVSLVVVGCCFSALLLIKFNLAAMQTVFMLAIAYYLLKKKIFRLRHVLYLFVGVAGVLVPFVLYFLSLGNFQAFIQEYFINTLRTVSYQENPILTYVGEWLNVLLKPERMALFILGCLGGWLVSRQLYRYRYFPLLSFIFVFGLTIRHGIFPYYYNICATLLIFLFVYIASLLKTISLKRMGVISMGVVGVCCIGNLLHPDTGGSYGHVFWKDGDARKHFYNIAYIMSQIENPKLLNVGHERGYGISCHTLPAGKYWATQNGATKDMNKERDVLIKENKADFIIVTIYEPIEKADSVYLALENVGYKECYQWGNSAESMKYLFTNKEIKQPPTDFHVSNMDVLLKRRIFK